MRHKLTRISPRDKPIAFITRQYRLSFRYVGLPPRKLSLQIIGGKAS